MKVVGLAKTGLMMMNWFAPISPRRLTCGYLIGFDSMCYPKKRSILNGKAEPPTAGLGRRRVWPILLLLAFSICFYKDYSVAADSYKQSYKQYAWIYLDYDIDEFDCLDKLYTAESQWNPKARNGSHYGIPQGKSKWLITASPYAQIRWGIKYNVNRYGTMCAAYEHWILKGWH